MTVQSTFPPVTLSDGNTIPGIAYGVGTAWYGRGGPNVDEELVKAVLMALDAGFRSLDCAEVYDNEVSVGEALRRTKVPREDIFITSKVGPGMKDIRAAAQRSLSNLGVKYLDLFLIHFTTDLDKEGYLTREEAWKIMEELKDEGIAKSIGVSNYTISDLERTLAIAKSPPVVNQVEFHPYVYTRALHLQEFMTKHNIRIQAYGPCVPITKFAGTSFDKSLEKVTAELSERAGQKVETHQTLLKLASTLGAIICTTTSKPERAKQQLLAGALPEFEEEELNELKTAAPEHKRFFKKVFAEE